MSELWKEYHVSQLAKIFEQLKQAVKPKVKRVILHITNNFCAKVQKFLRDRYIAELNECSSEYSEQMEKSDLKTILFGFFFAGFKADVIFNR